MIARHLLISSLTLLLASCAQRTAGEMTNNDFGPPVITRIDASVQQVLVNVWDGARTCGNSVQGEGLVPESDALHLGLADCSPLRTNGSATCDIYPDIGEGISRRVEPFGRVDLVTVGTQTEISVRVRNSWYIRNKPLIAQAWSEFAKGNATAVCPSKFAPARAPS
jgi:hypothetical protein